jgi:outer membrane protein assembly factor BamB
MFTGHWHANRRVDHGGLIEWGTQTFVMGGIDQSASGYRIVTFDGDVPTVIDHERLLAPHLAAVAPNPRSCTPPGPITIVAAAALDGNRPRVTARVDCGAGIELVPQGGWDYRAEGPALTAGTHSLDLEAISPSGRSAHVNVSFEVCAPPRAPSTGDWAQLGGGPQHNGSVTAPLAPPLQVAWTAQIGGQLELGTPVIAGDVVIVARTDRDGGDQGGLVALDLATGQERWRAVTASPITATPAVGGDTVVATLTDGEVLGLALADGSLRWRVDIAAGLPTLASAEWAPPLIDNALVFAGVQARFVALDLATGAVRWSAARQPPDPWLGSLAAPAAAGDTILAAFDRDTGLAAYSAATGEMQWEVRGTETTAIQAAPVVVDKTSYVCSAYGDVSAIDVATGRAQWTRRLTSGGFDWGYSITAAPAYANGRLFVPTQWNALVALDAQTGTELWRIPTHGGPLELAHYRSAQRGFAASPIVTGNIVWIGRPDGTLAAIDARDGHELWSIPLGAPVQTAPAPANDALIVATYDGTVHALVPASPVPSAQPMICPTEPAAAGCCDASTSPPPIPIIVVCCAFLRRRGRSARRRT